MSVSEGLMKKRNDKVKTVVSTETVSTQKCPYYQSLM